LTNCLSKRYIEEGGEPIIILTREVQD
jgi:hypothetical protein